LPVQRYAIRCYRDVPGDVGCPDVPAFADDLEGAVALAGHMLTAFFNRRLPACKPTVAHLEDEAGRIVARLRVLGPDATEWIDRPAKPVH
jgi:hypothetical protein